ncbi:porin family protein [Ponticaulis koreensis]|uniref:porin family protein n=1 Tax=Ponticaulis koreensis TaxID=1123045 RepID=UPI0003B4428A|nr:porin family protein [Ponticaulis koreensis]
MNKLAIALVAATAMLTPAAMAQEANNNLYVNLGYSALDGDGATLGAATARAGGFFNEYFGVEVEASVGVTEETVLGVELDLKNQYGAFVVGRYPVNENFDVFGRLGYGSATFQGNVPGFSPVDVDVDGFALGVGGQYFFNDNIGVRADYTRFEADDSTVGGGLDTFSIAAVYRFNSGS